VAAQRGWKVVRPSSSGAWCGVNVGVGESVHRAASRTPCCPLLSTRPCRSVSLERRGHRQRCRPSACGPIGQRGRLGTGLPPPGQPAPRFEPPGPRPLAHAAPAAHDPPSDPTDAIITSSLVPPLVSRSATCCCDDHARLDTAGRGALSACLRRSDEPAQPGRRPVGSRVRAVRLPFGRLQPRPGRPAARAGERNWRRRLRPARVRPPGHHPGSLCPFISPPALLLPVLLLRSLRQVRGRAAAGRHRPVKTRPGADASVVCPFHTFTTPPPLRHPPRHHYTLPVATPRSAVWNGSTNGMT